MKGKIPPASVMRSVCSLLLLHYTHVQIAAKFGLRDSTLSRYKAQLQKAGMYSPKQLDAMGGDDLMKVIYPGYSGTVKDHKCSEKDGAAGRALVARTMAPKDGRTLIPDYKALAKEALDGKLQIQLLWTDYLDEAGAQHKTPVSRSTFYNRMREALLKAEPKYDVYMKQDHPYGSELMLDYVGGRYALELGGRTVEYVIFVSCRAASNYTRAEFISGMTTEATCNSLGRMLLAYGCLPRFLVIDNAKALVVKHQTGRDAVLNSSFENFAERLGTGVIANNPYSPSSKEAVERSVGLIEERVLKRMPFNVPMSLDEYNMKLQELIDRYINSAGFRHGGSGTPRSALFEKYEKPRALPLPKTIPQYVTRLKGLRVGRDYCVCIQSKGHRHYYMVPYTLAGTLVDAEISEGLVTVYSGLEEVAAYPRLTEKDEDERYEAVRKNLDFMPPAHQAVAKKRLKYPDAESLVSEAGSLCSALHDFTAGVMQHKGFEGGRHLCIYVINTYKRKGTQLEKSAFAEAISRIMLSPFDSWNSYRIEPVYEDILAYAKSHGGRFEHQTRIDLQDEDESGDDALKYACLRGGSMDHGSNKGGR